MDGTPNDNFSLASVFSQSYFEIPHYQRDYAWERDNVVDLLDDIMFQYDQRQENDERKTEDHYFGTLVFENYGEVEPKEFDTFDVFGVVDGQQRLITCTLVISAITDEIRALSEKDGLTERQRERILEAAEDIEENYLKYEDRYRIVPNGLATDAYIHAVDPSKDVDTYIEQEETVSVEEKIVTAKHTIRATLQEWRCEHIGESDDAETDSEYFKFLKQLVGLLVNSFEVNVKVVSDVDRAARMFKSINDKGRGLMTHDKVKSHLVYCAAKSDEISTEYVYSVFKRVIKNITVHDGLTDADVDSFLDSHWIMYAGESSSDRSRRAGPTKIHKRIEDVDHYANIHREDYEVFVEDYVESLEKFSEIYPLIKRTTLFAEQFVDPMSDNARQMRDVTRKVQLLTEYGRLQRVLAPLLMASIDVFGPDSSEFMDLIDEIEKLAFRHYFVMSNSANTYESTMFTAANDLYWGDVPDARVEEVFNSDKAVYKSGQSAELVLRNLNKTIREKREDIAPIDTVIEKYLLSEDIYDGEFTPGWGGVRNTETIRYLLYEYELWLRSDTGRQTLTAYHECRGDFEVDHIVPFQARPLDRFEDHEHNRNRLGNQTLLSDRDNRSENNNSYEEKYNGVFNDSSMRQLRDLPEPPFTVDHITERETELVKFVAERWGSKQAKLQQEYSNQKLSDIAQ